ncbi:diguanylate cyclase [Pseudomonas typographi]|uniref:sensor domain-containing diguanylate cyclase n=1 Tax=Pseudomonas typographi TaxID=2715964 RepID=UPI001682FA6D|nr:diguanylate cyclase [Pseudomonas typographi]MBD1588742.1 diguanylate cyclase [Pseudomonas typographi]
MGLAARPKILGLISEGASAWLVACVGLACGALVTASLTLGLQRLAEQQLRQRFELLASERYSRLYERFAEQLQCLDTLRRYFAYSEGVTRSAFNGFAAPLLQRTQSYSWLPRVSDAERAAFEQYAQASGAPGYVIRERVGEQWVPAAHRPEYYPVLYIRAHSHLQLPLGFDSLSEPLPGVTLRKALAQGRLAGSAPLELIGVDPGFSRGMLLAAPVYGYAEEAGRAGQVPLGFLTAAISIRQLMTDGLPEPGEDNLRVAISDVTDPAGPIPFYGAVEPPPEHALRDLRPLHLADRVYELQTLPSEVFLRANRSSVVPVVALLGSTLSLLLAGLLYNLVSQRQRALQLVARRTLELSASEQRLRNTHGQLRSVLDAATEVAIIATDLGGLITTFNAGAERMLRYHSEQVIGRLNLGDLHVHHELRERVRQRAEQLGEVIPPSRAMLADSLAGGQPHAQQWSLVRRNGTRLTVNMLVTAVRDGNGNAVGHLAVCIDITESRRVHEALAARDRLLEKLSAEVPGGIYQFRLRADGRSAFTYASRGMLDIYELPLTQLLADADPVFERIHPDDLEGVRAAIRASAIELRRWRQEYRVCLPRQGLRWVRGEATPESVADGAVVWHGYLSDITDLKRVEEELRALSVTDALTGIYNRRYFQERLTTELARAERDQLPLAVIMLDIDYFKRINDQLGHAMGDTVLQALCRRIGQRLRRTDVFCRLGGEEFMILCPGSDTTQALKLAEELLQALREQPVEGLGVVTASFGVAAWRAGEGADALLLRADAGVYAAKQAGRNRVQPELP